MVNKNAFSWVREWERCSTTMTNAPGNAVKREECFQKGRTGEFYRWGEWGGGRRREEGRKGEGRGSRGGKRGRRREGKGDFSAFWQTGDPALFLLLLLLLSCFFLLFSPLFWPKLFKVFQEFPSSRMESDGRGSLLQERPCKLENTILHSQPGNRNVQTSKSPFLALFLYLFLSISRRRRRRKQVGKIRDITTIETDLHSIKLAPVSPILPIPFPNPTTTIFQLARPNSWIIIPPGFSFCLS